MKARSGHTRALLALALAVITAWGCSKSQRSGSGPRDGKITGSSSDPPVTFLAQWGVSNRYVFHSEVTTSTQIPRQGVSKMAPQESTLGLDYVISVGNTRSNGARALELEITSVQFEASMSGTTLISYDSMNKVIGTDGNPMAERLEQIIGAKITFQVSASNRISNVKGITEITDKLYSGGNARAQSFVRRLFTPQYLRHLIDLTFVPSDPVRVNDKWPGQMTLNPGPLIGSLTADVTYTFRGWQSHDQRKCALVEFSGTVKPRPVPGNSKNISSTFENGTITGKSWFDPELGMVVESASDQTASSKGTIRWRRAVNTNAPPQSYTSTLHQHTSIKLLDVELAKPSS